MFGMSPALIWLIIGIIFIALEFVIPGLVIAFFGMGALITALTTVIGLTGGFNMQVIVFIVASLASLFLLRRYMKKVFMGKSEGDGVNEFNLDVGKVVPVVQTIDPKKNTGKIKYQGTLWSATCEDVIPEGETARIVGRENITIKVEKIES